MANCERKTTRVVCNNNDSCIWNETVNKCNYKEIENSGNSGNSNRGNRGNRGNSGNSGNSGNRNRNRNNSEGEEPFGNFITGFEFNDTCMVITILFIILFMYKEELMKTQFLKKLLK